MNTSFVVKALVVVICVLLSVIVAIVAGLLSHASGIPKGLAVLAGGGAFAGSLTLFILVVTVLGGFDRPGQ